MDLITQKSSPQLLACVLFLCLCLASCQSCREKQQPLIETTTLATAQKEVDDLDKLFYDPSLDSIRKAWEVNYGEYFLQAQQSKSHQAQEFAKYAFAVARETLELSKLQVKEFKPLQHWGFLTRVRTAVFNSIQAIAALDPNTGACLKETEEEIKTIAGGCATGSCPLVNIEQVKPENAKIEKLIECMEKAFDRLPEKHIGQATQIAQKGGEIAKEAEKNFQNATGYRLESFDIKNIEDKQKMLAAEEKLLEGYLRTLAMLTIALKGVHQTYPTLKAAQE